jgi:hypothetical protein
MTKGTPLNRVYDFDVQDPGYWNFVFAAIFLLFIAYVAGRGDLVAWIKILMFDPRPAPKVGGATFSGKQGTPAAPPEAAAIPGQGTPNPPEQAVPGDLMKGFGGLGGLLGKAFGLPSSGLFKGGI